MTQEEKAKSYDEALERMKAWVKGEYPEYFTEAQKAAEFIFPELKESEDERMWKLIKKYVHYNISDMALNADHITREQLESWLEKQGTSYTKKDVDDAYLKGISDTKNEMEKQYEANYQIRKDIATFIFNYRGNLKDRAKWMDYLGIKVSFVKNQDEQNPQPSLTPKSALEAAKEKKVDNQNCVNPTDKNEPKFHEGEWVVYNHDICQIVKRDEGCNKLVTVFGIEKELVNERNLSTAHLWTIQDAKDGDVLIGKIDGDEYILIFKEIKNGWIETYGHYYDAVDRFCVPSQLFCRDYKYTFCPATKEQRDLLLSKMNEAGYEWDTDKKELKKIDDEEVNGEDYGIDGLWHAQRILEKTLGNVNGYQTDDGILDHKAAITAVKKLYEQKPIWSEEDEKMCQETIDWFVNKCFTYALEEENPAKESIKWLKLLKQRIGG